MKPSVQKLANVFARSALAVLAVLGCTAVRSARAAPPPPLLVVEVAEEDHAAAQRLLELTEQPAQLVRMPEARDPLRTLSLARAAQAERVVVFDQGARRVVVVRTRDASLLTRDTEASAAAPYLAAFVAIELLALPVAAPPAPAPAPKPARLLAVLGLRAGLEVLALSPYAGALRPSLGLMGTFRHPDATLGLRLELWAAPHASQEQTTAGGPLTLTRDDLAARAGLVWQQGRLTLSGFGQLGLAHIAASLQGPPREHSERTALALGLGFEPSVQLWRWLAVYASCAGSAHTPPGDYQVAGRSILRERPVLLSAGAGLYFTLPIR